MAFWCTAECINDVFNLDLAEKQVFLGKTFRQTEVWAGVSSFQ